jgi:PAS domain S-box-containing protein
MRGRLSSMTAGLAVGITAAVAAACALGTFVYSRHHFASLLEIERSTALAQAEVMRAALEHQMIEDDRSLIARMVKTFGEEARVTNVVLLDRYGEARYSSAPVAASDLDPASPTCQACHRLPPDQRGSNRVIETRDGTVLRTVIPFPNREACFQCHDPKHRINGILIFDRDVGAMRASMNTELRWMVAGTAGIAFVLILLIALVVRVVVLRRLQRFETTARLIAGGDLERRVPADGSDTVSWLAREFNAMADSMAGLLAEVRTQRERLERVLNSIDDGIVVLDPKRRVVAANDAFLRRTARSRQQVLGCCCLEVAPGLCTTAECPTLACLRAGERQVRICERQDEDGTVWEEVHASPILGPDGTLTQVVEVWRDISERRAAEAHLAESHRLGSLGLLASGFSHEMNTPLATVLTCVEAILREGGTSGGDGDWASVSDHAAIAREQVLRCRGITQHFLRLSRGQTSTSDIVDVPQTVAAVARLIDPTARASGVRVSVVPSPGVHIRADDAELQHALINIVLNAVQACGAGGEVSIAVEADSDVRIRVTDTGCGIAAGDRERIFEPFFSLRRGGTGLGLFLSLNFVRRWGGNIVVTSPPGGGSTFEIVFPPAAGSAAALRSAS